MKGESFTAPDSCATPVHFVIVSWEETLRLMIETCARMGVDFWVGPIPSKVIVLFTTAFAKK
jgi:hypothetical protein